MIRKGDHPSQVALKSIGPPYIWRRGENQARCEYPVICDPEDRNHKAPHETGRCGFYSYDRLGTVDEYIIYLAETGIERVIGATLNYGEMILGTFRETGNKVPLKSGPRGLMYRSEYSKIIALMDTGPLAQKAAEYYGVHCVPEKYFEMACKEFGKKLSSQEAVRWLDD